MHTYRVTIDTMNEQYVYEVEADDDIGAQQQALSLALGDGLEWGVPHTANVEELD
jgi:hypothetical protein